MFRVLKGLGFLRVLGSGIRVLWGWALECLWDSFFDCFWLFRWVFYSDF